MSRRQRWPDESTSSTAEGVPLVQPENNQKQQQQQNQPQYFDPVSMMAPPGNYGTTSDMNAAYRSMPPPPSQYDYPIPPDPAMAAAMAAAMHQQMQIHSQGSGSPQTAPQPYYFQGYPGGVPSIPRGYPPPPPMQYMQYNSPINAPFPPPPPPARPPRHERRRSDGKTPSPSPSPTTSGRNKKTFPMPPSQVVIPSQGAILPPQQTEPVHSAIPPLQDIFAAESSFTGNSSSNNNQTAIATNSMNYGSISATNIINNNNNKVYNAPPRAPPRMQPVLVRTSSSQDVSAAVTATNKKKFGRPGHRRVASETQLRLVQHQRSASGGARDLPPIHRRVNSGSSLLPRGRTYSGTNESTGGSRRGHRRTTSFDHSVGSMVSQSSVSVVSNIAKSAMFGGIDEGGRVQLHFPLEAVRVQVLDDEDNNNNNKVLEIGHLYMYRNLSDFDQFEEYIRLSEDLEGGVIPQWESLGGMGGKRQLLPETNYALPVGAGIYKQVVGEIADAHSMPCGLFFCGHHEDVAHPSILIAVGLVTILFVALIYAALVTDILQ